MNLQNTSPDHIKNMGTLKEREHDFSSKLRQHATFPRLKQYVQWQRKCGVNSLEEIPIFSPISINLDLTSSCNFACRFCVDSKLINSGKSFKLQEVKKTIDTLHSYGLLSVILIGGGEPTLHKDFEEIVRYIKNKKLQIGIVSNGSKLEKVVRVVESLEEKDWIRISIDAADERVFKGLHHPRTGVTLNRILEKAKEVKKKNPKVSLGYSFVVVWEGVEINGRELSSNMDEMVGSVERAGEFSFDYVSFKPCLVRWDESQRETLLKNVEKTREEKIIEQIQDRLRRARRAAGQRVKILESSNLKAMLSRETAQLKKQPQRCHMQFFRTVVTPFGIFHCPAFRGVEVARIGEQNGYQSERVFKESLKKTAESIMSFDAAGECKDVGCFYNGTNWWLDELVRSEENVERLERVENDNFFL